MGVLCFLTGFDLIFDKWPTLAQHTGSIFSSPRYRHSDLFGLLPTQKKKTTCRPVVWFLQSMAELRGCRRCCRFAARPPSADAQPHLITTQQPALLQASASRPVITQHLMLLPSALSTSPSSSLLI